MQDQVCYKCGLIRDCQKCSKCLVACYCSRECQTQDFPDHKLSCKSIMHSPNNPAIKDFVKITTSMAPNVQFARLMATLHTLPEVANDEKSLVLVPFYDTSSYSSRTTIIRKLGGEIPEINADSYIYGISLLSTSTLREYLKTYPKPSAPLVRGAEEKSVNVAFVQGKKKYYLPFFREDGVEMHVVTPEYTCDIEDDKFKSLLAYIISSIKMNHASFFQGGWIYFVLNRLPGTVKHNELMHLSHWGSIKCDELWKNVMNALKQNLLKG